MLVSISIGASFVLGFLAAKSVAKNIAKESWDEYMPTVINEVREETVHRAAEVLAVKLMASDLSEKDAKDLYSELSAGFFLSLDIDIPKEYKDIDSCIEVVKERLRKLVTD